MFLDVWQAKDLQPHFSDVWQGKDLAEILLETREGVGAKRRTGSGEITTKEE